MGQLFKSFLPLLLSPRAVKLYSVALAAAVGAACDAGYLPEGVRELLSEHAFAAALASLTAGLVLPEMLAGKKPPQGG